MSAVDAALRRSPLQGLARLSRRGRPAVLAYHGIPDGETFGRQLDVICDVMTPVGVDQFLTGDLPPDAVLITFDDGDTTVPTAALPQLRARELESVCFVVAGLIDTTEPFWWDEVSAALGADAPAEIRRLKQAPNEERLARLDDLRAREGRPSTPQLTTADLDRLVAAGTRIANHSYSHPCLDRCDDATVSREIHTAHERLRDLTGTAPTLFAYPNGNWDHRVERELETLGYTAAFLFDHRHTDPDGHPLRRSRLRMNPLASADRCRLILSGLHPILHRVRGRS